ncbi:MAG TPA: endonuclease/exonuclease/phosphatase family protein [Gemmatimonadales bacterium]|nr:endonuclease/exonuclease/phosphatase family protein [Gemmatimonadales bacterium]
MRNRTRLFASGLALLALGCAQDTASGPAAADQDASSIRLPAQFPHHLVVMNRNIYVGTDVDAVIEALGTADPSDDVPALLQAVATLNETDFTVRARGFAREVSWFHPDVIGIVEVSQIDIDLDLTPLGGPHIVAHEDFLPEIMAALAERHLSYRVAASNRNFTVEPIPGVRLVDYDVTLVGPGVRIDQGVLARNFTTNVGQVAPGVVLTYGFTLVPVTVRGQPYRVATTHLQDDVGGVDLSMLRAAQMQELASLIATDRPAMIVGDFNDPAGTPMYQVATGAGFTDVWASLRPNLPGFTCCHSSDLTDNRVPDQRIDFVMARGFDWHRDPVKGLIVRFGLLPAEMLAGPDHPIFVSDHIGLIASLKTQQLKSQRH